MYSTVHVQSHSLSRLLSQPTMMLMQDGRSVGIHTHCIPRFCTLAADLYAQSVPISKISASELRRKCVAGWVSSLYPKREEERRNWRSPFDREAPSPAASCHVRQNIHMCFSNKKKYFFVHFTIGNSFSNLAFFCQKKKLCEIFFLSCGK